MEKLGQRHGSRKVEGVFGKQGLTSESQGESRVGDYGQGTFQRVANAFGGHEMNKLNCVLNLKIF